MFLAHGQMAAAHFMPVATTRRSDGREFSQIATSSRNSASRLSAALALAGRDERHEELGLPTGSTIKTRLSTLSQRLAIADEATVAKFAEACGLQACQNDRAAPPCRHPGGRLVGYSKVMGSDEAGTLAQLEVLRTKIIEPQIAKHGVRLFTSGVTAS